MNEHEQRLMASISKSMAMMCVRNTMLEDIHAGIEPVSRHRRRAVTGSDRQPFESGCCRNAFASGIAHSSGMATRWLNGKRHRGFGRGPPPLSAGRTTYIARKACKPSRVPTAGYARSSGADSPGPGRSPTPAEAFFCPAPSRTCKGRKPSFRCMATSRNPVAALQVEMTVDT